MSIYTLKSNGDPSNRVDIVFMGDGYTASELSTTYINHVNNFISYMFSTNILTDPFSRYEKYFNIHVIDVISAESGVNDPINGLVKNTALDGSYNFGGGTDRLLYINPAKGLSVLNEELAGTGIFPEMPIVTANSTKHGGGGGYFAVFAGGNSSSGEVGLHEIGHSFAKLADEYSTGGPKIHIGKEPSSANVSIDPTGSKWSQWLGFADPNLGTVGAFEGADYSVNNIYRSTNNAKMKSVNQAFSPIAKEQFILNFYKYVDPLDDFSNDAGSLTLTDPSVLTVTPIDTDVIDVEWSIDGKVFGGDQTSVNIKSLGLTPGTYAINARAFDNTDLVRINRSELEQNVTWKVTLTNNLDPVLLGSLTDDVLTGSAVGNLITGAFGNDIIDGGAGQDTATYTGSRSDYLVINSSSGKTLVVDLVAARDGKDTLQNVENIRFGTNTLTLVDALVEAVDADNSAFQVYRFYNSQTGSHFFTTSTAERNSVIENLDNLTYEGNAFDSNVTDANGTAVFRFLNTTNGMHFYTADAAEAAIVRLNTGFADEGISYYASSDASNGAAELFRFYNTQNSSHFFTVSQAERDNIINTLGHYNYEGIAFFVDGA